MQFPFAKKSLGQNFLNSPKALADIIESAKVGVGDEVLEIGPGRGVLTKELLKAGAHVTAVEKDRELVKVLGEMFAEEIEKGQIEIVEGDVLEFDIQGYVKGLGGGKSYKLIANIPYYITGQIFRMFLEGSDDGQRCREDPREGPLTSQPSSMTLLVQKEVAERVVARDGKESILSLSVKAYGEPKYVSTVKRGSFTPSPNVDSAILHIANISKNFFTDNGISEKKFFEIVKAGFAHKRKILFGNLKEKGFVLPETIDQKIRAEDLKIGDWVGIVKGN